MCHEHIINFVPFVILIDKIELALERSVCAFEMQHTLAARGWFCCCHFVVADVAAATTTAAVAIVLVMHS